jgi:hypothetical protein
VAQCDGTIGYSQILAAVRKKREEVFAAEE